MQGSCTPPADALIKPTSPGLPRHANSLDTFFCAAPFRVPQATVRETACKRWMVLLCHISTLVVCILSAAVPIWYGYNDQVGGEGRLLPVPAPVPVPSLAMSIWSDDRYRPSTDSFVGDFLFYRTLGWEVWKPRRWR